MRLGLIAPELPPDVGGMAEMGRGLATALAAEDEVVVVTLPGHAVPGAGFEQHPVLTGRLARDAAALEGLPVDAWLALNAGLAPLAPRLTAPVFAYFLGNDFLDPWIAYGDGWLAAVERPYVAPLRKALRRAAVRRAVPALAGLLSISRSTTALLSRQLGVPRDDVALHPPGVDDAFFQAREAARRGEVSPGRLRILTVTRLSRYTRRKNVDGVLRALPLLAREIDWHYTVVGDGDDRPRLESLARELGIAGRVRFRGGVDQRELLAAYARADLFLLAARASANDVEGFGIVYLEAAAGGVPVIASRAGGAVDAVDDGENGLLIPESTPAAIAAGLERFAAERARFDPERVRAVAERFRWPRIAAGVRRAIAERLDAGAGR